MLCLLVHLGGAQYAIDARDVVEVLPVVETKDVPRAPRAVVGVINYHGRPLPVLDLTEHALGVPAERRLHSRIVVVRTQEGGTDEGGMLGLLVDQASRTFRCDPSSLRGAGVRGAAYLGRVTQHQGSVVQLIDPSRIDCGAARTAR